MNTFQGSSFEIGRLYGETFKSIIQKNVDILVKRCCIPPNPLPLDNPDFQKWVDNQKNIISNNWPWLIEEMQGVAAGTDLEFNDILFLNLRVWQYEFYSGKASCSCSSMVIELADGTIANTGALDDCRDYYCGAVKIIPENDFRFITFPMAGTSWGNRGMNSVGLIVGESSQILPGIPRKSKTICADVALRVILQTCKTVGEVKEFCQQFPFTINLVCSDKYGDIFCAHQTSNGLYELSDKAPYVITNHVVSDKIMYKFSQAGVEEFRESSTTRLRRGRLQDFASKKNGKCEGAQIKKFIADRADKDPSSICPQHNVALTYANPQQEPGIFWIADPRGNKHEEWTAYEV